MTASVTTIAALIKRVYPGMVPQNVAEREHPYFSMVKKLDDLIGTSIHVPTTYGLAAAAGSPDLLPMITSPSSSKSVQWTITRKVKYGVIAITAEALYATRNDVGAFVRARKNEVDSLLMHMGQKIAHGLTRNSGAALGRIAAIGNGDGTNDRLTLTISDDAINFYEGMPIVLSANDGSSTAHTLLDGGDQVFVRKVDLDAGYVYISATQGGAAADITTEITGAAANNYIFIEMTDATFGAHSFNGLEGWLPLVAPTSTAFNGVDRSVDPVRLGGHRLDNSAGRIDENIQTLAASMARTGTSAKLTCFMSHTKFANLVKLLGSKVEYETVGGTVGVGWRGVVVHSAAGQITCVPDSDIPQNRGYILDMSTWTLHTMRGAPHLVDDDGNVALRQSSSDGIELRARVWADLVCTAPGRNGVFSM